MKRQRQDAWTKSEDLKLAEITLRFIREGKTQLEAFKAAATELNRSSSACGFRWNATVRKQYEKAIQLAKDTRKIIKTKENQPANYHPIEQAITLLKNVKLLEENQSNIADINALVTENQQLKERLKCYEQTLQESKRLWNWTNEVNRDEKLLE